MSKLLILGGASSGKSRLAQSLAARAGAERRFYLATMEPCDAEDRERIRRHRAERAGDGFQTLELPRAAGAAARCLEAGDILLCDSVTALLANWMFPPGGPFPGAEEAAFRELAPLLAAPGSAVFVSDLLFGDAARYDRETEAYRRALGRLNRRLAADCDGVAEVRAGIPVWRKGWGSE